MLKRKIYARLAEWKSRKHKPLVVSGQRQVGKTFIIKEFAANNYEHTITLNFAENPDYCDYFKGSISADSILKRMSVSYPGFALVPGKTLIFLDEIQECQEAVASLKYLAGDERFDVIASGSMLGIRMPNLSDGSEGKDILQPMGYEERLTMTSLDFEEFLWAKGIPAEAISDVKNAIRRKEPIDESVLQGMNAHFRDYMIVGGMPEQVSAFVETGTFSDVKRILSDLNAGCIRDINRYNRGLDILKTTECYESIPDQLSESNKKFMYSRIRGERSRRAQDRYAENILWIKGAGYGNFCYAAMDLSLPLKSKRDRFKIYQSDTGMLVNRYGDHCVRAIYDGRTDYNFGAIAENAVAEGLVKSGYEPRFYSVSKGTDHMELDFVLETGDGLCVVEVKSGKHRDAPSLSKASGKFSIDRKIMLSGENIYMDEGGTEHYPLFAACFFRELEPGPDTSEVNRRPYAGLRQRWLPRIYVTVRSPAAATDVTRQSLYRVREMGF